VPSFGMYGVRSGSCHGRTTPYVRLRRRFGETSSVSDGPRICFPHVHQLLVFFAACVGGAINAVAGGGTLLTVPTLIWLGVPALSANATSTVALWPGSLSGAWGFRREMRQANPRVYALVVPSLVGGLTGAILLKRTPPGVFERLIPALILFATLLFVVQEPLQRRFNLTALHNARSHWLSWTMLFQLIVGIYGGYFGAGIGIMMLAALSLMGHTDIHQMNGLKNLLAVAINGIAIVYLVFTDLILWETALLMAVGATVGALIGASTARRVGQAAVRYVVVGVGLAMAVSMFLRL
jgi:uncharacterized protein